DVRGPVMPSTDALKVETKVGFTSLHENEEGRVVLTIANGNNDTLTLSKPQMSKVSHAKVTGSNDSDTVSNASADNGKSILEIPLVISPQSTVAIDFKIKANPTILPGKYIGLIDVDAKTSCGVSLHRVAAYEVTLGVFGQSELLTTIGVPSLLFLPGFLVLSIWLLIWRMGLRVSFLKKEGSSNDFFVAGTDPEFWLLGITFSLLMFISARNLWGLGYQRPYQLSDIATLWGASLGVGLLTYLLIFWVTRWREKYLEGRRVAKLLTSNDSVITALERIIRHGVEIRDCRRVKGNDTANSFCGFRLWSDNKNDMVWVIPPILCRKLNDKPFQLPLPGEKEDTTTIYNFLKKAEDDSLAEISWNSNGSLNKPTEMNITELSEKDESAFYFLVYEEFNKT
ncbi:hypothetical protein, partial [Methylicorpusculum sp.]|uniref:hypothetical protein n=1 Tax=Methylicorpusculum sp. TaxID=2713644 RepID=UPI002ABA8B6C